MKRIYTTLALTAALTIGMSAVAGADEHRGHRHGDGDRQGHATERKGDSTFRANRRDAGRDMQRRDHQRRDFRNDREHRAEHRHDWRKRQHRRAHKQARRHDKARQHWWEGRRQAWRDARRHRHGDRICYTDHRSARRDYRYYDSDGVSLWVDGLRFFIADSR